LVRCKCGYDFFRIETYGKIIKHKYVRGAKFDAVELRKKLKCHKCGARIWEDEISKG
jgi:hypothetical protein